jgi:hypothetical protein
LPHGVHRKQLTVNVDDAETILAAAGDTARPGRIEDGVSLLRYWKDGGLELGRDILVDNMPGVTHFDAIRSRNFIYAEHQNGDRELYDLAKDPYELQSQHANTAYDAIKTSLAARLHRLVTCAGATCRAHPAVRFTAVRRGKCGPVALAVSGETVSTVTFTINGRQVAGDNRAPFRVSLRFRQKATVRARVATAFDQVVTADRAIRSCR